MTTSTSTIPALRFDGQVALVTGATSGLGRGYALELARRGATVVGTANARTDESDRVASLTATAGREGLKLSVATADLAVESDARGLVADTLAGHGRLDVLVNNAGYGWVGPIQDGPTEQLRAMVDVHLMGTFWTMSGVLAHMRERGTGRIVNTTSGAGLFGTPGAWAYAAAKGAILAMTRCAALDNADVDVRINAISPIAATALFSDYRAIDPALDADRMAVERTVPALVFLAHPSCALSGQVLHAAGGRVALAAMTMGAGWGSDTLAAEDVAAHLDEICDVDSAMVLRDARQQYDLIPKGLLDFARWAVSPAG